MRMINYQFMELNLLKLDEKILLANVLLVSKYINKPSPPIFDITQFFLIFATMKQPF